MKIHLIKLVLALVILVPITNTYSQAYVEGDIPIEFEVYNPCCDEDVLISGTMHLVLNNSVEHITVSDITGVGSSGNNYSSHGVAVQNNINYPSLVEGTLTFKVNMVNDDGCSFKMKLTLHLTENANGEITANVEHVTFQCH